MLLFGRVRLGSIIVPVLLACLRPVQGYLFQTIVANSQCSNEFIGSATTYGDNWQASAQVGTCGTQAYVGAFAADEYSNIWTFSGCPSGLIPPGADFTGAIVRITRELKDFSSTVEVCSIYPSRDSIVSLNGYDIVSSDVAIAFSGVEIKEYGSPTFKWGNNVADLSQVNNLTLEYQVHADPTAHSGSCDVYVSCVEIRLYYSFTEVQTGLVSCPCSGFPTLTFDEADAPSPGSFIYSSSLYLANRGLSSFTLSGSPGSLSDALQSSFGNSACPVSASNFRLAVTAPDSNFRTIGDNAGISIVFAQPVKQICVRTTDQYTSFGARFETSFEGTSNGVSTVDITSSDVQLVSESRGQSFTSLDISGINGGWCIDDITVCLPPTTGTTGMTATTGSIATIATTGTIPTTTATATMESSAATVSAESTGLNESLKTTSRDTVVADDQLIASAGLSVLIFAAVAGGVLLCAVFALITFLLLKRRKRSRSPFDPLASSRDPNPSNDQRTYTSMPTGQAASATYQRFQISAVSNGATPAHDDAANDYEAIVDPSKLQVDPTVLGRGEFGVVYHGTYAGDDVAVKHLLNQHDEQAMQEFYAEAMLMEKIPHHENVLKFIGLISVATDGTPVIVTEYCAGQSLLNAIQVAPLGSDELWYVVRGIASGMAHLAANKVHHRDLACRNVLLTDRWTPKISDFGMSRISYDQNSQNITKSDTGPLKWMSGEALEHRIYNEQSDVWMFGATVVEAISRKEPHFDVPALQAATKTILRQLRPAAPKDCPPAMAPTINSCFAWEPQDRPTFAQIIEMLNR